MSAEDDDGTIPESPAAVAGPEPVVEPEPATPADPDDFQCEFYEYRVAQNILDHLEGECRIATNPEYPPAPGGTAQLSGFIDPVVPDRSKRIKCADYFTKVVLDAEHVEFVRLADNLRREYEHQGAARDVTEFAYKQLVRLARVRLDVLTKCLWRWAFERSPRMPWTFWTAPTVQLFDEYEAALKYELTGVVPVGFQL